MIHGPDWTTFLRVLEVGPKARIRFYTKQPCGELFTRQSEVT
jgi:hypothetical protein